MNQDKEADNSAESENWYDEPSKSQRKREMQALQDLGRQLAKLKPEQIKDAPVEQRLVDEILEYQSISSHEAQRRQMQFIGKLMRSVDAEAVETFIARFRADSDHHLQRHHEVEQWRDAMLNGGNDALTDFVGQHPATNVQHLRQILRAAHKDLKDNKNRGASKKLYREIKAILDAED